jgi:hypothetical protein
MSELLRTPNIGGRITASSVSSPFLRRPSPGASRLQVCPLSLRHDAPRVPVRRGPTPLLTLTLPRAASRRPRHLREGMTEPCSPRGGGR